MGVRDEGITFEKNVGEGLNGGGEGREKMGMDSAYHPTDFLQNPHPRGRDLVGYSDHTQRGVLVLWNWLGGGDLKFDHLHYKPKTCRMLH